jgi:hypothetical protein
MTLGSQRHYSSGAGDCCYATCDGALTLKVAATMLDPGFLKTTLLMRLQVGPECEEANLSQCH